MTIYTDFQDAAVEIIDTFPKTVTFRSRLTTVNPSAGTVSGTATPHTGITVSAPIFFERKFVDGVLILSEDVRIFLATQGLAFTPDVGWEVDIDSETWHVMAIKDIPHGSDAAVWDIQLRRHG